MSSASDDGSEYNPDRNHQHEEGDGSPEQPQSSRATGKGKTSKVSQQVAKQSKGQNKQPSNLSNMPPLPQNYTQYPPQPLGPSVQTDVEQVKADRQQLYALLRQQVAQGLPPGVSPTWALTGVTSWLTGSLRLTCRGLMQTMTQDLNKVLKVDLPLVCECHPHA